MLNVHCKIYKFTPSTIKATPISIAANNGLVNDNAPRMNGTIPKIIRNIERIFEAPSPENRPAIPTKTIRIPMI